jgi:hypothetical protein
MIRIDEIYNHTFWPWIDKNCQGIRMFFCDPFGHTDPEHLFNHGHGTGANYDAPEDEKEYNYVFMHDQEPVDIDLYQSLFDEVTARNGDLWIEWVPTDVKPNFIKPNPFGHIVVSEQGEHVEQVCHKYEWTPHYYFFHGWACLDWFRGYDKSFLIPRARDRNPTKTFMSPNRIVAGKRDHRVLFLYNVFKNQLEHNHISAPRICPVEQVDITSIAQKYTNVYQDITKIFEQADLPKTFAGEETQHMTSCWLTNFGEARDSLVYVPTETVYFGRRLHITEKTFKAIALEMPFILVAPAGSLEYLRSYGFKTFSSVFDESYDKETNDILRIEKVTKLLKDLDNLSLVERQQIHRACLPIVEHNYNHFYRGDFGDILWQELLTMLNNLQKKLS